MRILLTRHYKTQCNEAGRILGWEDSPPCEGWQLDVDFVVDRITARAIRFDAIYCSDLGRSRETAAIYAERLGPAAISEIQALREINYGELQTREKSWASAHYPEQKRNPELQYPGGESFRQMQQRSLGFVLPLARSEPAQTVLIVTHAGVIRGLVCHFLGLDYAANLKHKIPFGYVGDFLLEGQDCRRFDEIGAASGFVRKGVVDLPYINSGA